MAAKALLIERPVLEAMLAACREALPREACGLLGGERGIASSHYPISNVADEPTMRFEMEPGELISALAALEARGEELIAIYHSHPRTSAVPSEADLRECFYPQVHHVIVGYGGGRESVRSFRIYREGRAVESRWRPVAPLCTRRGSARRDGAPR